MDAAEPDGNGIKFAEYSRSALVAAVRRAVELYADRDRVDGAAALGDGDRPVLGRFSPGVCQSV